MTIWTPLMGFLFWREDLKLEEELHISFDTAGTIEFGVYLEGRWHVLI